MEIPKRQISASILKWCTRQVTALCCLVISFLTIPAQAEANAQITRKQEAQSYYAVMPLAAQGVDSVSALIVTDALVDGLIGSAKIRVMERAQMGKILQEQGFQKSGACDGTECAVEIGRLLAVDRLVVGSVGRLGEAYTITARTVNVETGEIIGSAHLQHRGDIDVVVSAAIPKAVNSLLHITSESDQSPVVHAAEREAQPFDSVSIASQIEVQVRDEAPDDNGALKPRIALVNRSNSRVDWIQIRWPLDLPSRNVVVEAYYAPKCEAHIERRAKNGDLVVTCSKLGLKPGQTWPGSDGMSLAIHTPEWKPWRSKHDLGLKRQMQPRTDVQVEVRSAR